MEEVLAKEYLPADKIWVGGIHIDDLERLQGKYNTLVSCFDANLDSREDVMDVKCGTFRRVYDTRGEFLKDEVFGE